MTEDESFPLDKPISNDNEVTVMCREHERISSLYLQDQEMGEKIIQLLVLVLSVGATLLIGLYQIINDIEIFLWISLGCISIILFLGLMTFQRLVKRHIRCTEYLRAINKIHCFFSLKFPSLKEHFYWLPCKDEPHFLRNSTMSVGLKRIASLINSIIFAILVCISLYIIYIYIPAQNKLLFIIIAIIGIISFFSAFFLHRKYENAVFGRAEEESKG